MPHLTRTRALARPGAADAGESDAAVADKFMEEVKRRLAAEMTQKHGSHENDAVGLGEGPGWRERYYKVKLDADDRAVKDVCREYWRGLQWVLSYYYSGCASWVYYYERHYAPFACDLAAYAPLCPPFWDKKAAGEPFKPLAQLLAVIPPGSAHCLPEACRLAMGLDVEHASDDTRAAAATARGLVGKRGLELMFPTKIKMDPNGRKHQWEWVALLPFLDERKLTTVIDAVAATFDDGERARNTTRLGLAAAGVAIGTLNLFKDDQAGGYVVTCALAPIAASALTSWAMHTFMDKEPTGATAAADVWIPAVAMVATAEEQSLFLGWQF